MAEYSKTLLPERIKEIEDIFQFGTERQKEILSAYLKYGSKGSAEALNLNHRTITKNIAAVKKRAQKAGYSPEHGVKEKPLPDHVYKRISTCRNGEGEITQQWLIQEPDKAAQWLAMQETVERLCSEVKPYPKISPANPLEFNNLLNQYTITDYHFGMLAWHKEGGADWNVKIAQETLIKTFQYLIERSPRAEVGMFLNLGDFMHYDGYQPVTPISRHIVDSDSRYQKIIDYAVDTVIEVICMMLQKYHKVVVINAQGNHDLVSSYWLQKICKVRFGKSIDSLNFMNPRYVEVKKQPLPFYEYHWGECGLFYHHGHKVGIKQQAQLYPALFPKTWGNTKYRYGHTGHYHHKEAYEGFGITMEMHNSITAPDSHSSHGGYIAERSANCISYHRTFGELTRSYIKPEMLQIA